MHPSPFGASRASFIQPHKEGIETQNLAEKYYINASCIVRVPRENYTYATVYLSALSQRAPNKQGHNLHHNVQQFEIRAKTTLKRYFD